MVTGSANSAETAKAGPSALRPWRAAPPPRKVNLSPLHCHTDFCQCPLSAHRLKRTRQLQWLSQEEPAQRTSISQT